MRLLWMLALPGCLWVGKEDHDEVVDGICDTNPDDPACPEVTPSPVPTPPPTPPPTVEMVTCFADGDGDGFGAGAGVEMENECESGFVEDDGDCDDGVAVIYPEAEEICGDDVDQDCDGEDTPGIVAFEDNDGDNYGSVEVVVCAIVPGFAALDGDCDDEVPEIYPLADEIAADGIDQNCDGQELCPADEDGDSFTGLATVLGPMTCTASAEVDCADNDPTIFPGASETVADGIDSDCDGFELCYLDEDRDDHGVDSGDQVLSLDLDCLEDDAAPVADDCDDSRGDINPSAEEICTDTTDWDCSGDPGAGTWYADIDGDGFGDPGTLESTCDGPLGYITTGGDCDDGDPDINPGGTEVPADGVDSDCDTFEICFADGDGDGFGVDEVLGSLTCGDDGEASDAGDCNDSCADCFPGGIEVCDGLDNTCDGVVDTDAVDQGTYFDDDDGDGYGSGPAIQTCDPEPGMVSADGDCAPMDPDVNPGAEEVCADGVDNNCNPDDDGIGAQYWADGDGDGFGSGTVIVDCTQPAGTVTNDADCDDGNDEVYPGAAPMVGDGVDQDCDGFDECLSDGDGDGYASDGADVIPLDPTSICVIAEGDCDDGDVSRNPGADELPGNNIDENCDGRRACYIDSDGDTYGSDVFEEVPGACVTGHSVNNLDCDDTDNDTRPGAAEICDGRDNNCDGSTPSNESDDDGDGYVTCDGWVGSTLLDGGDCDDANGAVYPNATEYCDGLDTDCNGFEEPGLVSSGSVNYTDLQGAIDAGADDLFVCGGPGPQGEHPVKIEYPAVSIIRGVAVAGARPRLTRVTPFDRILHDDNGIAFQNLIIDGNGPRLPDSGGCLRMDDGSLSLQGVLVRNCETDAEGGAIYLEGGATLLARDTVFESNTAYGIGGGAVYCSACESLDLSEVLFDTNGALGALGGPGGAGGAVLSVNANLFVFDDGTVRDNLAGVGAGIALNYTPSVINEVEFIDNTANDDGGGLFAEFSDVTVERCLFTGNSASARGQALHVLGNNQIDVLESSFDANGGATASAAAIEMNSGPSLLLSNSEVTDHSFGLRLWSGSLESIDTDWNMVPDNGTDIQTISVLGTVQSWDDPPAGTDFSCSEFGCTF